MVCSFSQPQKSWLYSLLFKDFLLNREFKQATFLGHGGRPEVGSFPSHYHIYIAKYLFTGRDDWFKNLGETNNAHFWYSSVGQKRRLLKVSNRELKQGRHRRQRKRHLKI